MCFSLFKIRMCFLQSLIIIFQFFSNDSENDVKIASVAFSIFVTFICCRFIVCAFCAFWLVFFVFVLFIEANFACFRRRARCFCRQKLAFLCLLLNLWKKFVLNINVQINIFFRGSIGFVVFIVFIFVFFICFRVFMMLKNFENKLIL